MGCQHLSHPPLAERGRAAVPLVLVLQTVILLSICVCDIKQTSNCLSLSSQFKTGM